MVFIGDRKIVARIVEVDRSESVTMAGELDGVQIRRYVCLSKTFLDVAYALIFIAVCMNFRKLHAQAGEHAAQKAAFLSLDCGNTQTNYTDSNKLEWVADDGTYIKTGNSSEQLFQNSSMDRPLRSFRYFPEHRSKHCYELPTPNDSYLFRASFYLNESLLHTQIPFKFIVSIDAANWFSIENGDNSEEDLFIVQEGIFYPPNGQTNFCLQPVYGVPFISSLELRSLPDDDNNLYEYSGYYFQYLALNGRYNLGADSASPDVRFPDDPLDRIWKTPDTSLNNFPIVSSPEAPDNTTSGDTFYVPPKVMKDAWLLDYGNYAIFPVSANGTQFSLMTQSFNAFVIVYSEYLNSSTSSSYNLEVNLYNNNSNLLAHLLNNDYDYVSGDYSFSPQAVAVPLSYFDLGSDAINISLSLYDLQNNPVNVTRGPTINALEIYTQCDFQLNTLTNTDDGGVIADIKTGFSLTDWQGDPCLPVPYDWLSCTKIESQRASTYYISSINISEIAHMNFIHVNASSLKTLRHLNEMSITNRGVDDQAFQILTNYCPSGLKILNFSYNALTSFPTTLVNNTIDKLFVLDLSYNQLKNEISFFDEWIQINSQSLQIVNISNNNLSGTFNSSLYFSQIPNLITANFDQNSIEGVLDLGAWYNAVREASIATSEHQSQLAVNLQLFSFVNNSISNVIPSVETIASSIQKLRELNPSFSSRGILLGGNPYCKHAKSYTQRYLCRSTINEVIKDHNNDKKEWLIIGICIGFVVLLLCGASFATLWRLQKQVYSLREIQKALADREVQPPFYQYSDLKLATGDFHYHTKLGAGGFGIVYKGVLPDQTALAIKKLFISEHAQALDEFLNEVILITGIKHRNLIQLKGCCIKDKERMLVYEYAENGNLAEALWGSKPYSNLNWRMRFTICLGVARGLCYLHEELQPSIIHRDIKPENILLDKDFKPKIADFGLARHFSMETTQAQYTQISKIAGTRGYFAPEYAMHGQLSEKADVYSYGVLLLEVVSGRKCIDLSQPIGERILVDWVASMWKKKLLFDVLQAELRDTCVVIEVIRVINIGLLCTRHDPTRRPSMSQVVTMFMGNMDTETFLGEFDNVHSSFKNNFTAIDFDIIDYPTHEVDEENFAVFPLIGMVSKSFSRTIRHGLNSAPSIELSSIHERQVEQIDVDTT